MNDTGLGSVVSSLHLREVDNVTAHRGSSNEATVGKVGELVAVEVSALLLLSSPVGGGCLGAVEGPIQVNADDVAVVFERAVNHGALGPGDTSVGNEDIETAIEVLDNGVCGLLNSFGVGNLNLVSLGCSKQIVSVPAR